MASESTPPARAARSASTLYECPCSGSEMPRYSRRKWAASKRAETRTVKWGLVVGFRFSDSRPPTPDSRKILSIISSLIPSSRNSSGVDCDRSRSSARALSPQSEGLEPSANSISVRSVLRRAASSRGSLRSTIGSVQCAPPDNAAPQKHPLQLLQENLSRRLETLPVLRFRRDAGPPGWTDPQVHAAEVAGVRAADGEER